MLFHCQQSVPKHKNATVTGTCLEPQGYSGDAVTQQFELLSSELLEITKVKQKQEMRENQLLSERRG